jgi:hypothetical protein
MKTYPVTFTRWTHPAAPYLAPALCPRMLVHRRGHSRIRLWKSSAGGRCASLCVIDLSRRAKAGKKWDHLLLCIGKPDCGHDPDCN